MSDEALYSSRLLDPFVKLLSRRYSSVDLSEIFAYAQIMPWEVADPAHWLTQQQVNRFVFKAIELTGNPGLPREAGQYGASVEMSGAMRSYVLSFVSPHAVFDKIGSVTSLLLRSSTYTPEWLTSNSLSMTVRPNPGVKEEKYQCDNRVGAFEAVLQGFQYKYPEIEHPECMFRGGSVCRYIIRWEKTKAANLRRLRHIIIAFAFVSVAITTITYPIILTALIPVILSVITMLLYLEEREHKAETQASYDHLQTARDELMDLVDLNYNQALMASEIGQIISHQTTVDTVLASVVKVLEKRLEFERGMILLANKDKSRLTYCTGFGHREQDLAVLSKVSFHLDNPESRGVFVKAFHEQVPYLVEDFEEFEKKHTPQSVQVAKALGTKSFVCCPIVYDGESIGVLAVDKLKSKRALMERDKSLLMGIAPVVGVSIRNAELLLSKEREFNSTLHVLAASIDARDPLTAGHSEKVTEYSVGISAEMNLGDNYLECVRVSALLHDYGKIGVPDSILKKDGPLTTEEYEVIKSHSSKTREILERISFEGKYTDVPIIAGYHHEKWNGTGYPLGLVGEQIPLGSRIIAVADYFEAITAKRHYRDPMPIEVAIDELVKQSGSYFDPQVVNAFLRYYRRSNNQNGRNLNSENAGRATCLIRKKRISLEAPVTVKIGEDVIVSKTQDISLGGIYISIIDDRFGKGFPLQVDFLLPESDKPVVATGRVAWVNSGERKPKPDYPNGCGLEFKSFDENSYVIMKKYLEKIF